MYGNFSESYLTFNKTVFLANEKMAVAQFEIRAAGIQSEDACPFMVAWQSPVLLRILFVALQSTINEKQIYWQGCKEARRLI